MEEYCIRIANDTGIGKYPVYHVTSTKQNYHGSGTCAVIIKNSPSDENRHYISFGIDMDYLALLSKNYLMRLLNEQLKYCILGSEINPVTEDEAARIICAARENRESQTGWLKVSKFLGKQGYPGQGDISLVWSYVCFDTENKKYITVSDDKNWSYCNPNLQDLQKQILNHEDPYFYTTYSDYGSSCDGYIATLDSNITESLVRMGILDLPSSEIKSDLNTNENAYINKLDNDPDIYKLIDEKDGLRQLHESSESISFYQELSVPYQAEISENNEVPEVFLDENKIKIENNQWTRVFETEFDEKEHILKIQSPSYTKIFNIPAGIGKTRKLRVIICKN